MGAMLRVAASAGRGGLPPSNVYWQPMSSDSRHEQINFRRTELALKILFTVTTKVRESGIAQIVSRNVLFFDCVFNGHSLKNRVLNFFSSVFAKPVSLRSTAKEVECFLLKCNSRLTVFFLAIQFVVTLSCHSYIWLRKKIKAGWTASG